MKKTIFILFSLFLTYNAKAQLEWISNYHNENLTETVYGFAICEKSDGLKQLRFYKDSQNKWKMDVMHNTSNLEFAIEKTSEIVCKESSWAIQTDFKLVGVYNVVYNQFVQNKIAFELVFEDPNPQVNETKYWTYIFDEDGTFLGINFGIQGQIVGNYLIHESCQPNDITRRIWTVLKFAKTTTSVQINNAPSRSATAYPNPSKGIVNIAPATESNTTGQVHIYDLKGNFLETISTSTGIVDLTKYENGYYILKTGNTSFKILKN